MGCCVAAVWNMPGSWADGKCASKGLIYDAINIKLPDGYCILVDTAFKGSVVDSKIIGVLQKGEYLPLGMGLDDLAKTEKSIIHCQQPSEWGNNQLCQFVC
jgi:hypothetical protein